MVTAGPARGLAPAVALTTTSGTNRGLSVWSRAAAAETLVAMTTTMPSYAPHTAHAQRIAARAVDLVKSYGSGETEVRALDHVSIDLVAGEFTAIMGPSGSGKSTLMHAIAGLDSVDSGSVVIGDVELSGLSDKKLTALRRDRIGFVFQAFNLVPTLTALENITLPIAIAGRRPDQRWLDTVIDSLAIRDRLAHRPSELSGGQQQRVAVARALASRPQIVFGDEPTGNLDSRTSGEVLSMLRRSVDDLGQTVVIVTHDPAAAAHAHRVVFLSDGRIVDELREPTAERVLDRIKAFEYHKALRGAAMNTDVTL